MNTPYMKIRLATVEDCRAILALRKEGKLSEYPNAEFGITREDVLKIDLDGPAMVAKWTERLSQQDVVTWVVEMDGQVVGCGSTRKKGEVNEMFNLFIAPEWRGKGIGTRLVEARLQWLGGERDIEVHVTAHNRAALNYTKYGFVQSGTKTNCSIPGKPFPTLIFKKSAQVS